MDVQANESRGSSRPWVNIWNSLWFLISHPRLLGVSVLLMVITICLTWVGYTFATNYLTGITGDFFSSPPASESIVGWIKYQFWAAGKWLFIIISRMVTFYFAFLFAYTISTPGYSFLSAMAEKLHAGERFDPDAAFTLRGVLVDLWEGIKIAFFGILVTIVAIMVNFIPVIGQVAAFTLYVFYAALMFLDFPASRRRWSLSQKLGWLREHGGPSFRLGLLPALVGMVPVLNIFLIAMLFPLLTTHAAINFSALELSRRY